MVQSKTHHLINQGSDDSSPAYFLIVNGKLFSKQMMELTELKFGLLVLSIILSEAGGSPRWRIHIFQWN